MARAKVWMDFLGAVRQHAARYAPFGASSRQVIDKLLARAAVEVATALVLELDILTSWVKGEDLDKWSEG